MNNCVTLFVPLLRWVEGRDVLHERCIEISDAYKVEIRSRADW